MRNNLALLFDLAGIAFFLSVVLTPLVRSAALRWNLVDNPDGGRKLHKCPIPRVGGIAVTASYLLSFAFILVLPYAHLDLDLHKTAAGGLALSPAIALIFAVGLVDDLIGLRPWQKLAGQIAASVLAYAAGFGIHVFMRHPLPMFVSFPATVVWLVGSANALNLIDGLDGLAAGIGFCASCTTLVAAVVKKSPDLALVTAPLAGSLLGFLRYNFNPASIFLGDCGSLVIGFLLGCYGAVWNDRSATSFGMTAPVMAMCVPLLDVAVSIFRRFLRNRPIFGADAGHIHHRLLERGLTPRVAALLLYAVSGFAACLSLWQELSVSQFHAAIVISFCVIVWIGISSLQYPEFGIAQKLIFGRSWRQTIDFEVRLRQFTSKLASAADNQTIWEMIRDGARTFGMSSVRLNLAGSQYEAVFTSEPSHMALCISIPLSEDEAVSLVCGKVQSSGRVAVEGLANAIQSALLPSLERRRLALAERADFCAVEAPSAI